MLSVAKPNTSAQRMLYISSRVVAQEHCGQDSDGRHAIARERRSARGSGPKATNKDE